VRRTTIADVNARIIDAAYFPNTQRAYHWSADLYAITPWAFAGAQSSKSRPVSIVRFTFVPCA
jgi:hypothetical protein